MIKNYLLNSDELTIYRFGNGVKIIPYRDNPHESSYLFSEILPQDFPIYFLDTNSALQKINDSLASIYQLESAKQAIGKSIFDFTKIRYAQQIKQNDLSVMKNKRANIFTEPVERCKNIISFLSIKYPLYDENNTIFGMMGLSMALNLDPSHLLLPQFLKFASLDLLKPKTKNDSLKELGNVLTVRESEIMYYIVRGYTAKRVAHHLKKSHRTIEDHIRNIKAKTGVNSKHELIELFINEYSAK